VEEPLSAEELAAINDARSDDQADGTYFDSYAHIGIHREMIGDGARTRAYLDAIEAHASELRDKVVLDVGCGTGILSMFAARAGARKVYAVDASGITRHARRLVAENGYEGVVDVIRGRVEDLTSEDIPERVDVVVSEWMGYALFFESMLNSVVEARDAFAKPDALVLPNVATVRVALLSDDKRYDDAIGFWDDVYGLDFSSLAAQTRRDWSTDPPVVSVSPSAMLSDREGEQIIAVDCAKVTYDELLEPMGGEVVLVAERDARCHGLVLWFDVDFYGRAKLSTSPTAEQTHWYQTVLMFEEPCVMRAGAAWRGTVEPEPGSDPGAKRQLHVYANKDLEPGETLRGEDPAARAGIWPEEREHFAQWVVQ